jgi:hypothetical protein
MPTLIVSPMVTPVTNEDGSSALRTSRGFQVICGVACLAALISLGLSVSSGDWVRIAGFAVATVCFAFLFGVTVRARHRRRS